MLARLNHNISNFLRSLHSSDKTPRFYDVGQYKPPAPQPGRDLEHAARFAGMTGLETFD